MLLRRTYLDSGVLLEAWRGQGNVHARAMAVLDDPNREFVISDVLYLEILPKPTFHKNEEEVAFMTAIFEQAVEIINSSASLTEKAIQIASRYDLAAVDALHISAALQANVDEFVTSEKSTKPIFKVAGLRVISLQSSGG